MSVTYQEMYSLVASGRVYHGTTAAAGVLLPASNSTSPTVGLWNPQGSLNNAAILGIKVGWVGTTGAPGTILFNALTGAGTVIATGAPISAFNQGTPVNALIGQGLASSMRFSPAGTNTLAAAGSVIGGSGVSQLTITGASTAVPMWNLDIDLGASWVIPPNTFFYLTGSAALLSAMHVEICWAELPIAR